MSHLPSPDGAPDRGYEPTGYPVPTGGLPPRPPGPGARIGRASGVELRQEAQRVSENAAFTLTVLAFRLFEPGNPQPLDVQLRGRSLAGTVREGDWIEVTGPPDAAGRWDVASVANLTTGATVLVAGGRRSRAATVVVAVLVCVIALVVVLIAVGVIAALASS